MAGRLNGPGLRLKKLLSERCGILAGMMAWSSRGGVGARQLVWLGIWLGVLGAERLAWPQAQGEGATHTLHVYVNTIQVPVLVLGPNFERLKQPIAGSRFSLNVDSGPWFRATHVRQEGEDPISLAIVLDVSGDTAKLMPKMNAAIASLAPRLLHAQDRVSIYAPDCELIHLVRDLPADPARLRVGVEEVLALGVNRAGTKQAKGRNEKRCERPYLWDSLAYATTELGGQAGRRVILAISDGNDQGSRNAWTDLRVYAQTRGVAIFGVTWVADFMERGFWGSRRDPGSDFVSVCEMTGGVLQKTTVGSLDETLQRFVTMVRDRYIVEFPRPYNSTAGSHELVVKIDKANHDVIRSAGVSMPIPDAAILTDPNTIPADPSLAPQQGPRHVLTAPK
jgi:hypothetical protein